MSALDVNEQGRQSRNLLGWLSGATGPLIGLLMLSVKTLDCPTSTASKSNATGVTTSCGMGKGAPVPLTGISNSDLLTALLCTRNVPATGPSAGGV